MKHPKYASALHSAGIYAAHLDGVPFTQHLLLQTILALHHLKTETHNLACTAS